MSTLAKRIVIWLVLLTISVQGVTAVTSVLQGPAHYHSPPRAVSSHQTEHTHAAHHPAHSHHGARQVRRHYHLPNEDAVLVPDHQHDIAAAEERTSKGPSVSPAFVALIAESPAFHMPEAVNNIEIGPAQRFASNIPRRIERPPRVTLA